MVLIAVIALIGAVFATAFRCFALSRHGPKLTPQQKWTFDAGARYGWLAAGLALLVVLALRGIPVAEFVQLTLYWLLGLAAIWLIPERFTQ